MTGWLAEPKNPRNYRVAEFIRKQNPYKFHRHLLVFSRMDEVEQFCLPEKQPTHQHLLYPSL